MASILTTTNDVHGVRVVTQIIPLVSPEPVQHPKEKENKKTDEPGTPYMTRMFLKGEPVALGTVQIMIGIIMITMGAITWFTQTLYGEIPLGLGLSFIFSGSLTLSAHKGTCAPAIKGVIALNIISALMALSGICYFCFAFTVQTAVASCSSVDDYDYVYYYCSSVALTVKTLLNGIKAILLILSVLEVCVCVTTVVFSCKAILQDSWTKTDRESVMQGECSSQAALLNAEVAAPPAYEP